MGIQYNYFHLRAKQCSTFFYRYVNVIEILTYTRGYYLTFHGMRKYKHWYFTTTSYLSAIFCYSLIHIYIYIVFLQRITNPFTQIKRLLSTNYNDITSSTIAMHAFNLRHVSSQSYVRLVVNESFPLFIQYGQLSLGVDSS